jgi:hypothetical protein
LNFIITITMSDRIELLLIIMHVYILIMQLSLKGIYMLRFANNRKVLKYFLIINSSNPSLIDIIDHSLKDLMNSLQSNKVLLVSIQSNIFRLSANQTHHLFITLVFLYTSHQFNYIHITSLLYTHVYSIQ